MAVSGKFSTKAVFLSNWIFWRGNDLAALKTLPDIDIVIVSSFQGAKSGGNQNTNLSFKVQNKNNQDVAVKVMIMVCPSSKVVLVCESHYYICESLFRAAITRFTANIEGNIFVLDHVSTREKLNKQ